MASSEGTTARILEYCDHVCRLLLPPIGSAVVRTSAQESRRIGDSLAQVEGTLRAAVKAWLNHSLLITGAGYQSAVQTAEVLLDTLTQAVDAAHRVLTDIDLDADMNGSGSDHEAYATAAWRIASHGVALAGSVMRLRIGALTNAVLALRRSLASLNAVPYHAAMVSAAESRSWAFQSQLPLSTAVMETSRSLPNDTFKVPASVHDVLKVSVSVGRAIRGEAAPADEEEEANNASPPTRLRGNGFLPLLQPQRQPSFASLWLSVRNAASGRSEVPRILPTNRSSAKWSALLTTREESGRDGLMNAVLEAPQTVLFALIANHLHTTIGRYPANVTATYALAVVLLDVIAICDPFDMPLSHFGLIGNQPTRTLPQEGDPDDVQAHSRLLSLVQPIRTSFRMPENALYLVPMVSVLVGIGVDKFRGEIDRIVATAVHGYEAPPDSTDPSQVSGSMLTILCSVAQPILAVFAGAAPATTPQLELFTQLVWYLLDRVTSRWTLLLRATNSGRSKDTQKHAAAAQDLRLLRTFFVNHPTLSADVPGNVSRRERVLSYPAWRRE